MSGKIPLDPLPQLVGLSDGTLRLLLTVLLAYPVAQVYRAYVLPRWSDKPAALNAYNVAVGLALSYFFNGTEIVHSLVTVLLTQLLCTVLAPSNPRAAAALVFVWNFGYLLVGYWLTQTEGYDLGWTCPQCILCLKLIGYGMDVQDGLLARRRAPDTQTKADPKEKKDGPGKDGYAKPLMLFDDNTCPLPTVPSLVQLVGFAYQPVSFIVGPQLSFSYYWSSLQRGLLGAQDPTALAASGSKGTNGRIRRVLRSVSLAILYLAGNQLFGALMPVGAIISPVSDSWSLPYRLGYMIISHRGVLMRYLGIWSLCEGACVLAGLGYNGLDEKGQSRWDGLANIYPMQFELSSSLTSVVGAFNINTNRWAKRYIFKRLRFLGSKQLSALGTLAFLAIWHGFHPGYLLCFGMEFLDMEAERRMVLLWRRMTGGRTLAAPVETAISLLGWLWTNLHLTYGLAAMEQRVFGRAWLYWQRVGFFSFWVSIGVILTTVVVSMLFRRPARSSSLAAKAAKAAGAEPAVELAEAAPVPVSTHDVLVGPQRRRASVVVEQDDLEVASHDMAAKIGKLVKD
ncbi:MBOAT, membrane-bound O-acyltransferase family-domain-containing protein [Thamnocephalis sphaerospora]|uniref:Lysophospholipid acyltransferase 5 n=1 Tax=Thamnocephalis sphaerospora TaxID=78915 RepID=A0A4P9XPK4_9FUNG|nr:MBOAT, membrane-bound O-acyltransferase family-domain-containing protein [Thamnocephalis sphaerospora]|eukprot:RKP07944.1 MBOAT, membrane-bound O-acyltransferase family-domain-containing protein [Thamnocephalis sphaerospora]